MNKHSPSEPLSPEGLEAGSARGRPSSAITIFIRFTICCTTAN